MNKKFINLSIPFVTGKELKYLKNCLETGWLSTAGNLINKFEQKISNITKSKYTIACMNGTSAIHISLLLAGVKQDHEVIAPTITFIAPINAIIYCNAKPIFMDSDEKFNLDIDKTIEFLKNHTYQRDKKCINKKTKKIISALIIVHVWGNPINFYKLKKICDKKNIKIIEDASESLGSFINNSKNTIHTGNLGFIGCLSFNGNKIITTGGGGAITTNNKKIADKARYLTQQAKDDNFEFIHNEIGFNYRMTNIQAAVGLGQLDNFNKILNKKRAIFNKYNSILKNNKDFKLLQHDKHSNCWMNLLISQKNKKLNLLKLSKHFHSSGVEIRPVWKPNHLQKQFKNCQKYKIQKSIELYKNSFCLPSGANTNLSDLKKIISLIK